MFDYIYNIKTKDYDTIKKYVDNEGGVIIHKFWDNVLEDNKDIEGVWYIKEFGIVYVPFDEIL